jgi:hypothetical protein
MRPTHDQGWSVWLEAVIGRIMSCNTHLAKDKKRAQSTRVRTHAKKVQLAEIQLKSNPTNVEVRDILSDTQCKLVEVFQDSVARNRHLSTARWFRYGDTCSKPFFDFHRVGKKKALIRELETKSGTIMGQSDLTDYITDYYKHLCTSKASAPGMKEAQELCWLSVLPKVAEDTNSLLTQKLTFAEVLNAIRALPKGKTPGHDGVPMEFFHECAQDVAPDLVNAFTVMLKAGETSPFINKGQITFIPKSGDQARLGN